MGEIGRDRLEYLYEMSFCEIALIIRGYRKRNVLQYQLQRIQAFAAMYAMRGNQDGKEPKDVIPLYFDNYLNQEQTIDDDEINELRDELNFYNEMGTDD